MNRKHKEEWNETVEARDNANVRTRARWSEDEIRLVAMAQLNLPACSEPRSRKAIAKLIFESGEVPNRTIDAIESRIRKPEHAVVLAAELRRSAGLGPGTEEQPAELDSFLEPSVQEDPITQEDGISDISFPEVETQQGNDLFSSVNDSKGLLFLEGFHDFEQKSDFAQFVDDEFEKWLEILEPLKKPEKKARVGKPKKAYDDNKLTRNKKGVRFMQEYRSYIRRTEHARLN